VAGIVTIVAGGSAGIFPSRFVPFLLGAVLALLLLPAFEQVALSRLSGQLRPQRQAGAV
jgi:hypothetical protein